MLWTGNSYLFAEYPRQLSTDIDIENYKFKASFVSNKGPEKQNWYHSMIFILILVENCLLYDVIHDFSVWLRTGSYPGNNN